ncbi:putative expansin-A30 [Panicum virgatum]|uniref:Expansin n=1 Tax=Panicum virgatum TaxID=38727 RepID=A0A8T0NNP9_PANVG|nr:putative expansin-A30 [Panicum virgatum]KAG2550883.1 hypothetical protein PVAP13_9KG311900 [Panicum virgatum]
MASPSIAILALAVAVALACAATAANARFTAMPWTPAHATFYGDETAAETMGGACGYGNLYATGYGTDTAALSTTLFKDGFGCGTCYQIRCAGSPWCYRGSPAITVTATNLCPPNWALDSNRGGWCNPPRAHFDLSKPAFMRMAQWRAGIVPVAYRRVPCVRRGGLRFALQGNPYWLLAYVMNVAGAGDVAEVAVRSGRGAWVRMSQNWGASFQAFAQLGGRALSFRVTSYTTRQTVVAADVAAANWCLGLTYQARVNFS